MRPVWRRLPFPFVKGSDTFQSFVTLLCLCLCLSYPRGMSAWAQGDPLGATPHPTGTTFRVWAPFVEAVAVRINDQRTFPLHREPGHPNAEDTVWIASVPNAKRGDRYLYVITFHGATQTFNDPRAPTDRLSRCSGVGYCGYVPPGLCFHHTDLQQPGCL